MEEMLFWGGDIPQILRKYLDASNLGTAAMTEQEQKIYKLGQDVVLDMLAQVLLAHDGEHLTVQIGGLDQFEEMDIDELSKRFSEMQKELYD